PGLPLVPVVGRVDVDDAGDVRVRIRAGDLEADVAVVRHRVQRVHGVQLPAGVLGVVHSADAQAELEAQVLVVPQRAGDQRQVLAGHVQAELVAVHDDLLHGVLEVHPSLGQHLGKHVDDLVEVAAVGPWARPGPGDHAFRTAVPGGVAADWTADNALVLRDYVQG